MNKIKNNTPSESTAPKVKEHEKQAPKAEKRNSLVQKALDFKEYVLLSKAELRKVSWPNWKETRTTSLVVLGFVVVMSIVLALVDLGLSSIVRMILA